MLKKRFIEAMVAEDIGRGDLFGRISKGEPVLAYVIAKSDGLFAGREYIDLFTELYDLTIEWHTDDGVAFEKGKKLFFIRGNSNHVLALERSILDIALHASSIATLTNRYLKAIEGIGVKLLDTRKTRPLLREFEKYAVRCGGGLNHRMGLDDCLMLKDTHMQTIKDLDAFMAEVRQKIPFTAKVEIECESVEMAKRAMHAGADIIMCDNMGLQETEEVVKVRNADYPHILLEASGNVTLGTIQALAKTGVDAISSGSIIHQANWIDLSMKVDA
ncbi:MAG TPA: carboxylating nicotinate-nucleotide diphosphorylase [Epsilonproteobacteria bacterium]|nr:carboxylating nicotinate-nucleotide diphosphorylase [Campylobacterota bacterium]